MIALTLCFVFLLSLVSAASDNTSLQLEAGEFLKDINVYRGYADGSLGLERPITRAEFAATMVRIVGPQNISKEALQAIKFTDVKSSHWAYYDISIAAASNWVKGYEVDNTYRPSGNITYGEVITILVRVLGYDAEAIGQWPTGHIDVANKLGITKHLSAEPKRVLNRGEVAILLREALFVPIK